MRHFALIAMLFTAAACASSDGVPTLRQDCEDRYDTVWMAAHTAVTRLGGKVVSSNRGSGSILGRLDVDVLGAAIDLHINLSRLPDHQPGSQEPVSVRIKASERGVSEPEPNLKEELRSLEERYLRLVGERATCGDPM